VTAAPRPPLADLHRHLDGSLRPATVVELAAAAGVAVPEEHRRVAAIPGMDAAGMEAVIAFGHAAAFRRG
jgi:adenosine deaminase